MGSHKSISASDYPTPVPPVPPPPPLVPPIATWFYIGYNAYVKLLFPQDMKTLVVPEESQTVVKYFDGTPWLTDFDHWNDPFTVIFFVLPEEDFDSNTTFNYTPTPIPFEAGSDRQYDEPFIVPITEELILIAEIQKMNFQKRPEIDVKRNQ